MSLHRKNYIAKHGERFGLLVDQNGIPDFWTTLYLTTNVRHEKHSTQKAFLNHLTHLHLWEMTMGERLFEPYQVCRRPNFLRECPDEKSKIYP